MSQIQEFFKTELPKVGLSVDEAAEFAEYLEGIVQDNGPTEERRASILEFLAEVNPQLEQHVGYGQFLVALTKCIQDFCESDQKKQEHNQEKIREESEKQITEISQALTKQVQELGGGQTRSSGASSSKEGEPAHSFVLDQYGYEDVEEDPETLEETADTSTLEREFGKNDNTAKVIQKEQQAKAKQKQDFDEKNKKLLEQKAKQKEAKTKKAEKLSSKKKHLEGKSKKR